MGSDVIYRNQSKNVIDKVSSKEQENTLMSYNEVRNKITFKLGDISQFYGKYDVIIDLYDE